MLSWCKEVACQQDPPLPGICAAMQNCVCKELWPAMRSGKRSQGGVVDQAASCKAACKANQRELTKGSLTLDCVVSCAYAVF